MVYFEVSGFRENDVRKILVAGIATAFLIGGSFGFYYEYLKRPFELDYDRVVFNLPMVFRKYLYDRAYPLGEKYYAEDMARAFEKNGKTAKLFTMEDTYSNINFKAGFEVYLRAWPELGLSSYHGYFDKDRISVLVETIPYKISEVRNADIVFTGSLKKNGEYRKLGINSYFLPQFTSFDKFYPAFDERYRTKILYVANRWEKEKIRKSLDFAIKNGFSVDVYGVGWEDVLEGDRAFMWKGYQIVGDMLKYYYSSADIVLNDTRDDMRELGVISNRIFDVTACQGFIISDYMPEIEEIYGDSVPMYKNEREFKTLIDYYLGHPEERKEKAKKAHLITKERFGADTVIPKMIKIMDDYRQKKEL